MFLGPFVRHRLLSSSRNRSTFYGRSSQLFIPLLIIGGIWMYWQVLDRGRYASVPLRTVAYGLMFSTIASSVVEMLRTWEQSFLAIPQERDRKTLDALLSTRLSSLEIVMGLFLRSMIGHLEAILVALPVTGFLFAYWGFDPREWLFLNIALFANMFVLSGFGLAVSLSARTTNRASARAVGLSLLWMVGPLAGILAVLPRLPASISRLLYPVLSVGLDSSPMGLLANVVGLIRRGSLFDQTLRMIELELILGVLGFIWTIWRFRAAARSVYDTEGRLARALRLKVAPRKQWPACGEDPVFWRDRCSLAGQSRVDRWSERIMLVSLTSVMVWGTYYFAKPSFQEVWSYGYLRPQIDHALSGMDLFTEAYLRGWKGSPPPGLARPEFNMAIRLFTPMTHMLILLVSVALAAESLVSEQRRDTWLGLIVTPLSGSEILRGKMLGVLWKVRKYIILLLTLWSIGLAAGAIHPLGFAASLIGLATSCWLSIVFGLYIGLDANDKTRQLWAIPFFLLLFSFFFSLIPLPWGKTVLLGFGSMPFLTFLSLISYEDLQVGWKTGAFLPFDRYGVPTGGGIVLALLTCLLGWITQVVLALYFHKAAIKAFERVAGRPVRSQTGENLATTPVLISQTA